MLIPDFAERQYREFIESVMCDSNRHETFIHADSQAISNYAHVEYNPDSDTIIVDYRYEYPATINNIPTIRRAIYRALMY